MRVRFSHGPPTGILGILSYMLHRSLHRAVVALHYIFMAVALAIPTAGFFGKLTYGFTRWFLIIVLVFAAVQGWFTRGQCILTMVQRRLERRIHPDKNESCGFINEQLKPLGIFLSPNIIRVLTAMVYGLDLYFLIFR